MFFKFISLSLSCIPSLSLSVCGKGGEDHPPACSIRINLQKGAGCPRGKWGGEEGKGEGPTLVIKHTANMAENCEMGGGNPTQYTVPPVLMGKGGIKCALSLLVY